MKKYYYLRLNLLFGLCFIYAASIAQKHGQAKIDSLLTWLKNYKPACAKPCMGDTSKVKSLSALAWEISYVNPDTAIVLGNEALHLSNNIGWQLGIANSNHKIGWSYYIKGDYPLSLEFYIKALEVLKELSKATPENLQIAIKGLKASILGNIGIVYDIQGNYKKALDNYSMASRIFKNIDDKKGIANSYTNIGIVYSEQGNYTKALDNYFTALKLNEELKNTIGIAELFGNIGMVYDRQENYPKALEYFFRGLKVNEELGNKMMQTSLLGNIGNSYYGQENYSKAIEHYEKALRISKEVGNPNIIAGILGNIGSLNYDQKNYPKALGYYFEGLKIFKTLGNKTEIAQVLGNIGKLYKSMKKYTEAKRYLFLSLEQATVNGDLHTIMKGNKFISDLFIETGDYKKALDYYEKSMVARDSLFNREKTEEITRKEMQYEFDKKEAITKAEQEEKDAVVKSENEKQKLYRNSVAGGAGVIILSSLFIFFFYKRKRDAVQKQKETALSLQVSETEMKALRSQMNPHFIYNAMHSIQFYLRAHKSAEAEEHLLKFADLMRLVLENSQHSEVPLEKDMSALELYMQLERKRLQYPFTYQFNIDNTVDKEETYIPPLILQPFVENAIWHGLQYKPEPGHIQITIRKRDNDLFVIVEDNGIGRNTNSKAEEPKPLKKESFGIPLTEERLKILNETKNVKAYFNVTDLFTKDNQPAGTKVELSLPLIT